LVRIANIEKLYKIALAFYYALDEIYDIRVHLCVYHSQYPLLLRSAIECQLDMTLNRKDPTAVFRLSDIQNRLNSTKETEQLFIVLGSPVTEVGRDHDYDWAVIEPSSVRSLIQLAGRIRRHRTEPYKNTNIMIFEQNIRSILSPGDVAYNKPGFEDAYSFRLKNHKLQDLLKETDYKHLDAKTRIIESHEMTLESIKTDLVALEHARLKDTMYKNFIPLPRNPRPSQHQAYENQSRISAITCCGESSAMLSALLPEYQPFRKNNYPHEEIVLLPDANNECIKYSKLVEAHSYHYKKCELSINSQIHRLSDNLLQSTRVTSWGKESYLFALKTLSEEMGISLEQCAYRYGVASLPKSVYGWFFHPVLGFITKKNKKNFD
jgi:CRISPR-associated endonuclease/helicase Cas3